MLGGYIGLCLGYSFLQIPDLIFVITRKAKKYYLEKQARKNSVNSYPLNVSLHEIQLQGVTKPKVKGADEVFSDKKHFQQTGTRKSTLDMDSLADFINKINEKVDKLERRMNE